METQSIAALAINKQHLCSGLLGAATVPQAGLDPRCRVGAAAGPKRSGAGCGVRCRVGAVWNADANKLCVFVQVPQSEPTRTGVDMCCRSPGHSKKLIRDSTNIRQIQCPVFVR